MSALFYKYSLSFQMWLEIDYNLLQFDYNKYNLITGKYDSKNAYARNAWITKPFYISTRLIKFDISLIIRF